MPPTVILFLLLLVFTSMIVGAHGHNKTTSSLIPISTIHDSDNSLFVRSVRNGTSIIYTVVASEVPKFADTAVHINPPQESPFLDLIMKKYSHIAPLMVVKLQRKNRTKTGESSFERHTVGFILGVYDTTAGINVTELKLVFGSTRSQRVRIVLWIFEVAERTLDEIFKDFWAHNVLNVNLIVQDPSSESWDVFTYNPFAIGANGTRGLMEKLDSQDLFPDKLADLHNHTIPISVFYQFPTTIMTDDFKHLRFGPDTELLRLMSRKMNFSIDLKTAHSRSNSYETILKNNKTTGVVGDIINGRSDVVWNRQYVENYPNKFVEITYPYHTTRTCILVRKADLLPMVARILTAFPLPIWYAVFVVLGILVAFMVLAGEKKIFQRILLLVLFQNLDEIPKKNVNRVYSISWIFWSLLMVVIYKANLIKDLMMPEYYWDIETLDDLYETGLTLYVGYNMFALVNNSEIESVRRFADKTEVEFNFDRCIGRLIRREPVACAIQELIADFLPTNRTFIGQNGPELHKMKEHLTDNWEAFFVKRGFPYLEKFNDIIQKLVEGGFYDMWMSKTLDWYIEHIPQYGDVILKLRHFEGAFCILFLGLAISTLSFICEVCSGRFVDTDSWVRLFRRKAKTR